MSFSAKVKNEITNKHFTTKNGHSKITNYSRLDGDKAMLAGHFLKSGSVSDPLKSYHLEFLCNSSTEAGDIKDALSRLGISGGVTKRKAHYTVYIKDSNSISDLLAAFGAFNALLEYENTKVLKEMREGIQRRVNCETANISRTVSASMKQAEDIRYIEETAGLSSLPDNLRRVAELRLEFPEAALSELAEHLPETGRSGINHRLRKISKIAKELRAGRLGIGENIHTKTTDD